MDPITVKACKGCGNTYTGNDQNGEETCPICGCQQFSEKVIDPKTAKCSYCKTTGEQALKSYRVLPWYNVESNTFYCGCRGWD